MIGLALRDTKFLFFMKTIDEKKAEHLPIPRRLFTHFCLKKRNGEDEKNANWLSIISITYKSIFFQIV